MDPFLLQPGQLLRTYLRPLWRSALLVSLLLLTSIAFDLLGPQILRAFIDTAERSGPQFALTRAALFYLAITLVGQVVRVGATVLSEQVGWRATNVLRADLLHHALDLDLAFHRHNPPGALIERIDGDVTALANFFSQLVSVLLGNGLLIIGVLTLLWVEDWRIGVGIALYALVTLLALGGVQRFGAPRWQAAQQVAADLSGFVEERLRGTEDIRANGAGGYVLQQLDQLTRTQLVVRRQAQLAGAMTYVSTHLLFAIGYATGLALGAWLYTQGNASIGTAFLITAYVGMLANPLEAIRGQVEDLQQASAGIARVGMLFAKQPAVRDTPQITLPTGALAVAFDHVSFGYDDEREVQSAERGTQNVELSATVLHNDDEPETQHATRNTQHATLSAPVLHDITFTLDTGQVLGVLGRTGSGKTTLTRLLFRLYDPSSGAIRVGGADVRMVALGELRRRVGMVTQDVQIFGASVRDNLTLFRHGVDDATIWEVLATLGLHALFAQLPRGLDTLLGSAGLGLSAGQAQLLACARVFLRNPGLIILDEASSRLDPATEALLEQAIDRLLAGRTAIIIAHRLATVRRADAIAVLDGGRIAEYGPRAALAADPNSRFAALLRTGIEEVLA